MYRRNLLTSIAVSALCVTTFTPDAVAAQERMNYNIPSQDLGVALRKFAKASKLQVIFDGETARGKRSSAISHHNSPDAALKEMLQGTGLTYQRNGKIYIISPAQTTSLTSPYLPSALASAATVQASTPAAAPQYDEIIVTAQKKEERITDVPIAISAFSAEALDDYKIEGGSELLRAIPNVNFSKSNFSMYNFSIRGIGTKAISASSDPAVAVSFNNSPLVRNRLFEAEFFDIGRIEVLRGPQGTLYGRNATAGVVNLISALPKDEFSGELKLETGNFKSRRIGGMLNIPLSETAAIRAAGTMTKRDGYDYNTFNQTRVNGRDLWSTRITVGWEPSEDFSLNLVWQRFKEDDNRSRTGKQLCTRDDGPESIAGVDLTDFIRGRFTQGCQAKSIYDDDAFGAPNGYMLAYLWAAQQLDIGYIPGPAPRTLVPALKKIDPYANVKQSRNLREISTSYDPVFKAKNDVVQLNFDINISKSLKLSSQSMYSKDDYFSTQDYGRFVSDPVFNSSSGPFVNFRNQPIDTALFPGPTPNGKFCDYQLGCSDRIVTADLSQSDNSQWYQELRVQSDLDGPLNFNVGANYLKFRSKDDYYVFNNLFTLLAEYWYGTASPVTRFNVPDCPLGSEARECPYVETNPIGALQNIGHNYFLSQNGVKITSKSIFGELYYNLSSNLKLTIGSRYTEDRKNSTQIPSQLLLGGGPNPGVSTGGRVNSGYPAQPNILQAWKEFTGRAVLDWKPETAFSDETLVYASVARGYKGGGTNPPRVDINPLIVKNLFLPQTFEPEFNNAFEIGTKNTFGNGKYSLNLSGFFYDYKNYQISQIQDRIAYNENFDVMTWGLEIEAAWRPSHRIRIDSTLGYLRTKLAKDSKSIDVMNRTQGNPDWILLRPWLQAPSNCVAPRAYVEHLLTLGAGTLANLAALCATSSRLGDYDPRTPNVIPLETRYGFTFDPFLPYDPTKVGAIVAYDPTNPDDWINRTSGAPNQGRGFDANLAGNELPNAPRITFNVGGEYSIPLESNKWSAVLRADYYYQAKSFARIYNTEFDRIRSWSNVNMSFTLDNERNGLSFQIYVKNVFNKSPITDFFVNSDDTGLTANVFTLDPRIIGGSARVKF
jgi:outer membrane receptor protein involved in Fe transport